MPSSKNIETKNWLYKPYPLIDDAKINLILAFGLSLVCFLFLLLFRPFHLDIVEKTSYFIGFGITVLISTLTHFFLLPFFFKNLFIPDNWKIYNQLLFITSMTLFIAVLNYFYNSTIGKNISPQYNFLGFIYMTTLVASLPILILTYVTERVANNKNQLKADEIEIKPVETNNNTIHIQGENLKDDSLSIGKDQFVYAQSSQNYSTIHYLYDGELKNKIIRISLKNFIHNLPEGSGIIRCHKSFAINKTHIHKIKGNARSLLLNMNHIEKEIPVSRSFDTSRFN